MATTTNKNTNKRPASKSRPLSTAKSSVKSVVNKPVKKKPAAKKPVTKPVIKKKPAAKPKAVVNKVKPTKAKSRQFNLPLGRSTKLVVTLKRSKPKKSKKPTVISKKDKLINRLKRLRSNKSQVLISITMVTVGLMGSVYFGLQVAAAPPPAPKLVAPKVSAPVIPPPPVEKSLPHAVPSHLRIPAINVDTSLLHVGLDAHGAIAVPAKYDTAGWYTGGPTPGEIGPAIIVGHLDNIHGMAVFWRLYELIPGQTIEVDRTDGQKAIFIIESIKEFPQGNLPPAEVYGNIEYAGLRLITCGGTFNKFSQHYSHNTVVFARLVK